MRHSLPKQGLDSVSIDRAFDELASSDFDWRRGRVPIGVIHVGDAVQDVAKRAFMRFFTESSSLAGRAYPSIEQMEQDIVEIGLELLSAPADARGSITTGGSESIILALKACREWARRGTRGIDKQNVVVPYSAHPVFAKACELLDLEERRVALRPDLRTDVDAMAGAMDDGTILIAGSVPCYPHGTIDPMRALGSLALDRDVWLHVDACGGGYFAPFARRLGYPVPEFDFSVPGVRSISADLHKLAYCPKPASTIYYRDAEDFERQVFDFDSWPAGRFRSPNLSNTRPGGASAAAWAVMHYLGEEGYLALANRTMRFVKNFTSGVNEIEGLEVLADPELTIVTFGSTDLNVYAVAQRMQARGWMMSLCHNPRAIHNMLTLVHEPALGEYLVDLEQAVAEVRGGHGSDKTMTAVY